MREGSTVSPSPRHRIPIAGKPAASVTGVVLLCDPDRRAAVEATFNAAEDGT